jgi:hypothetical protein
MNNFFTVLILLFSFKIFCDCSLLEKKTFLHPIDNKPRVFNQSLPSDSNNTNKSVSKKKKDSLCSQVKEYKSILSQVEGSLKELMKAFEEHLEDIRSSIKFENSPKEKENLQKKERDIVDYYLVKTSELFNIYDNVNTLINNILRVDCSTASPTNQDNDSIGNQNYLNLNSTTNIAYNLTHPVAENDDSGSGAIIHSDVITIFMQKLQEAASEAGLPTNYVETRLKRVNKKRENLQRNSRKLKH